MHVKHVNMPQCIDADSCACTRQCAAATSWSWDSRAPQLYICLRTGVQGAAHDSAALLLLAQELSKLLGTAGQAVVHKLSQAHCQWDLLPADRSGAQPAHRHRSNAYRHLLAWMLVLALVVPVHNLYT